MYNNYLVFLSLLLFLSSSLHASESNCPEKVVKVAFDNRGLNYFDGVGFDIDILKLIEKKSKCKFITTEMPRARIFEMLKTGEVGMAFFVIRTPERSVYSNFIPYMLQENFALINTSTASSIKNLQQFESNKKLKFGKIIGFKHEPKFDDFLDRLSKENRIEEVSTTNQLIKMVSENRIQGGFSLPIVYEYYKMGSLKLDFNSIAIQNWDKSSTPFDGGRPHEIALSKKSYTDAQFKYIEAIVLDLQKSGEIKKVLGKYLKNNLLSESLLKMKNK